MYSDSGSSVQKEGSSTLEPFSIIFSNRFIVVIMDYGYWDYSYQLPKIMEIGPKSAKTPIFAFYLRVIINTMYLYCNTMYAINS